MVRYSLNVHKRQKNFTRFKSDFGSSPRRKHSLWWVGAIRYPRPDLALREWDHPAHAATGSDGGDGAPRAPHQQSVHRRHLGRGCRRILCDSDRRTAGDVASASGQLRRQNVGHDIVLQRFGQIRLKNELEKFCTKAALFRNRHDLKLPYRTFDIAQRKHSSDRKSPKAP